ncbi:MAG TPA: hypothetical protein VM029_08005 [Opitutaceae bacterium]|nr:hypothetical protein [Opitutaceae bacterium]
MKNVRIPSLALTLAVVALAGCDSTTPKKTTTADNAEYEYVTPLGSNIPVRVRKGTTATSTTSPTNTLSAEQAANMIQQAGSSTPDRGR